MHKEQFSQLELFSPEPSPAAEQPRGRPMEHGLLEYIRLYEKAILVTIGFIVIGMVAFCFGVEKGKKNILSRISSRIDTAELAVPETTPAAPTTPTQVISVPVNKQGTVTIRGTIHDVPVKQEIILEPQKAGEEAYTIQIASYKGREGAERESQRLRAKGFSPVILKKGDYSIVCVGTFTNKEKARSLLTQLRPKYRDCYIRRL